MKDQMTTADRMLLHDITEYVMFVSFYYFVSQVALGRQGYHCGDDEMRWWQFGSSTLDALKTFQVRYFP